MKSKSPMSALLSSSELKKSEGHSQFPLSDFHSAIEGSLDTSLNALSDHPDSIYFARRVILLRDLVSIPPLEGIPGNGKHLGLSSPLAAYAAAEKEEPGFAKQIIREQSFWTSVFSSDRIPPDQLHDRLDELNSFPTLLFYASIARQEICLRAGAYAQAKRLQDNLVRHSLVSTGALTALGLLVMMLFTLGAIIWIGFLSVVLKVPAQIEEDHAVILQSTNVFDRFVVPIKERIPNKDRKLRAGDLLDCFAVYLLLLTGIGTVLGLLTQLIPHGQLMRISQLDLIYLNIGFALLSYLGASGLALLYLSYKARIV